MTMNSKNSSSEGAAPKSKNWLLIKFRQWHGWGGIIAALFLLVVSVTGIVLNYKKPILSALGLEKSTKEMMQEKERTGSEEMKSAPAFVLRADTAASLPITFEQAIRLARKQWGDGPLENIQLKREHGQIIYKIKQWQGDELWIDAHTGDSLVKDEYEKVEMTGSMAKASKRFDWGKLALDLHTGKIGGEIGKAFMTGISVLLLLLTISGIYLWTVPVWRKRQSRMAQTRAAAAQISRPRAAVKKTEELVGV